METLFDSTLTLKEARGRFFDLYQLAPDGGYKDRWVHLKMWKIPLVIPNTPGRVRAVRYHDLHHLLTGYATNWRGEAEISAWELATGCADHYAAWVLNFGGIAMGLLIAPRRTYEAFIRGRYSRNLYREPYTDDLLDKRLGEAKEKLGLNSPRTPAHSSDMFAFSGMVVVGTLVALLQLGVLMSPVVLLLYSFWYLAIGG